MSIQEVANGLTALVQEGKFDEATERFYADDIESVEAAGGDAGIVKGKAAVQAKGAEWSANHTVHGLTVSGPFVNGDQFAVPMTIDMTQKATGARFTLEEVAVYTVQNGKIVHERFFYNA